MPELQKIAWRYFTKENGIVLKADSLRLLEEYLRASGSIESEESVRDLLSLITCEFLSRNTAAKILERSVLEAIISHLEQSAKERVAIASGKIDEIDIFSHLTVESAFQRQPFVFDSEKKAYSTKEPSQDIEEIDGKTSLFHYRYDVLRDRVLRSDLFSTAQDSRRFHLVTTNHLKGSPELKEAHCLFGLVSQAKEGRFFLEDRDGSIELDFSESASSTGMFTEGCFLIVSGSINPDGRLLVSTVGLPPAEPASITKSVHPLLNRFTGGNGADWLRSLEEQLENTEIYFLFEVWIDEDATVSKFYSLLESCNRRLESREGFFVFVIGGSFLKKADVSLHAFNQLFIDWAGTVRKRYPTLMLRSRMVFIPSDQDPVPSLLLPKGPLPVIADLGEPFVFASNPCRLRFLTQEIVIFRDDATSRLQRNSILMPDGCRPEEQVVQTLFAQAHLSPFSLAVRPLLWKWEQALHLNPLPDLLVLFDRCEPFSIAYAESRCVNPGSFGGGNFLYAAWKPSVRLAYFNRPS